MASADTKPNRRARSPSVRAPYSTLTVQIHLSDRGRQSGGPFLTRTESAMPASPPPTSSHTARSTPWSGPAAIGCSPRRPAAPCRPRRRVPQPPGGDRHHHSRRQACLPCLRRLGRVRTRPDPRTHQRRAGRRPGPRPPRRPTLGHDRPQAPGGPADVSLGAGQRGRDRHDPWGQPRLRRSAPHRRQPLTRPPHRCGRFFKRSRLADPLHAIYGPAGLSRPIGC